MTIDMAGKLVQFLVDMGATYSVLTSHAGPLAPETSIVEVEGKRKLKHFTTPLTCTWGKTLITHEFLVVPNAPAHYWKGIFSQPWGATLTLPENQNQGIFLSALCIIQDTKYSPRN